LGPQGHDGNNGAQGNDGKQGPQGNAGNDGTRGPQGNDGQDGSRGPQGNDGKNGAQGNDGQDGSRGPQGNDGNNGAQGNDGQDGKDGSRGPQGNDGNKGPQGNDGQDGSSGPQGNDGNRGFQGNNGIGAQGGFGPQGLSGPQGGNGSATYVFCTDQSLGEGHFMSQGTSSSDFLRNTVVVTQGGFLTRIVGHARDPDLIGPQHGHIIGFQVMIGDENKTTAHYSGLEARFDSVVGDICGIGTATIPVNECDLISVRYVSDTNGALSLGATAAVTIQNA